MRNLTKSANYYLLMIIGLILGVTVLSSCTKHDCECVMDGEIIMSFTIEGNKSDAINNCDDYEWTGVECTIQ